MIYTIARTKRIPPRPKIAKKSRINPAANMSPAASKEKRIPCAKYLKSKTGKLVSDSPPPCFSPPYL
jgi:hypothetical protein